MAPARLGLFAAALALVGGAVAPSAAAVDTRTRLVSAGGVEPAEASANVSPSIAADGQVIAFQSFEDALVPGDTNGFSDVLVRRMSTTGFVRASVSATGGNPNGASTTPAISGNGRYVVFVSDASNLVSRDGNGVNDVFLRDLVAGRTLRLSGGIAPGDLTRRVANPTISGNGDRVAFQVSTGAVARSEVYVRTVSTGRLTLVSVARDGGAASGSSFQPTISRSGQFVAFLSLADNLVANDGNGFADVFRRSLGTGRTVLVSKDRFGGSANGGALGGSPALSWDGRFVVFVDEASDLVGGDTNGEPDVFRRDLEAGRTVRVSVTSEEQQVTGFGGFHTVRTGVSDDGRFVVFSSDSSGLAQNDQNGTPDVFLRDVLLGTTRLVSADLTGQAPDGFSISPSLTPDGRYVAYNSEANGITVDDDDDFVDDVFRRTLR